MCRGLWARGSGLPRKPPIREGMRTGGARQGTGRRGFRAAVVERNPGARPRAERCLGDARGPVRELARLARSPTRDSTQSLREEWRAGGDQERGGRSIGVADREGRHRVISRRVATGSSVVESGRAIVQHH
jgi:hypothetical protein